MVRKSALCAMATGAITVFLAAYTTLQSQAATQSNSGSQSVQEQLQQLLRREDDERNSDPKWRASHVEIGSFRAGPGTSVTNFCVNVDGNLLVCVGGDRNEFIFDEKTGKATSKLVKSPAEIRVFTPGGTKLSTWPLKVTGQAICVDPSGAIFIGGLGKIAQLDQAGKVIHSVPIPGLGSADVSGIAVTGNDLFVVAQSPTDFGFEVTRFTRDLKSPKRVLSGLSGCCGQMDIQARKGELWVAHNGRHKVERYSRDGKLLSSFGKADRKEADGFGGCCEPKNIRFASDGTLLAAESGPPTVVKRFDLNGKFLGVVAMPNIQTGCVRVTVEASKAADRYYVINADDGTIHIIGKAANGK